MAIPIDTPPPLSADERRQKASAWLIFFWAMAPIAIKYAGRTETRRAVNQIDLLTTALIALSRLVRDMDGPDPWLPNTNRVLDPALNARLPRLGPRIDARACLDTIRALCAEVERLHPALAELGAEVSLVVLDEVHDVGRLAESVIMLGDQPPRVYR